MIRYTGKKPREKWITLQEEEEEDIESIHGWQSASKRIGIEESELRKSEFLQHLVIWIYETLTINRNGEAFGKPETSWVEIEK